MPTVEAVRELAVSGPGWGPDAAGSGGVESRVKEGWAGRKTREDVVKLVRWS